jgi:hypothetical protein
MLNAIHDYKSISRTSVEGKRLYSTPDGGRVPSVTTVLDKTKPQEKIDSLNQWRKKIGHENATRITTESANRGTRMHTFLENYVKNGGLQDRPDNPFSWASHAMANTVIEQGLKDVSEIWGIEVPLYYPELYAGTTDSVGIHLGKQSIIDYKQTNKPKKKEWIDDYFIQMVAYAIAHNKVYNTNIRKGVIMMCVQPEMDALMNIVTPPQYQQFELTPEDFPKWEDAWWSRLELYYKTN